MKKLLLFSITLLAFSAFGFAENKPQFNDETVVNCNADFTPQSFTSDCSGLSYHFYMGQPGDITTYLWDFGDGNTSTLASPEHTYDSAGTYQICLIVSGNNNCHDTVCKSLTVFTADSYYADFSYIPDSQNANGVHFTNTSVGNANYYTWNFGDGTGSSEANPYHVYAHAGVYQVSLLAFNPNFCYDSYVGDVFVFGNDSCQALFYPTFDTANQGLTVQFNDTSVGSPVSYAWNFGDGQFSTQANPSHTFTEYPIYVVCLTITTNTGCQSSWCDSIYLANHYYHNEFSDWGSLDHNFHAHVFNGVAPYTYTWDFGDGSTGSGETPTHLYAATGAYNVSLTTTDANGSVYTGSRFIFLDPAFINISGHVTAGGAPLDGGLIDLYHLNTNTNDLELFASVFIHTDGYYWFSNAFPSGTYFLFAKPDCYSVFWSSYSPAYYQSSAYWGGAIPIVLGSPDTAYNIALAPIVGPIPGNGSISGTINQGLKMTTSGPGLPNVEILLLNMNNDILAVVYSDAFGKFSFTNLANGTYQVYAEMAGVLTIPAIITLSDINPVVNNLVLAKTPSGIIGINENTEINEFAVLGVYPNPTSDFVTLSLESSFHENLIVEVVDMTGRIMLNKNLNISQGVSTSTIDFSRLQAGFYTLSLIHENGKKSTVKIFKMK